MFLESFLQYVEDQFCDINLDPQTIKDIQRATDDIVSEVLKRMGDLDSRFKVSQIIPVGSFAEGTKIMSPNEFDFMVCLETLSGEDQFRLQNGCDPCFKMVFIQTEDEDIRDLGIEVDDDNLDVFCLYPESVRDHFIRNLEEVVANVKDHSVKKSGGHMMLVRSEYLTLKLHWLYYTEEVLSQFTSGNQSPEVTSALEDNKSSFESSLGRNFEVDVDLMPAIRINDVSMVTQSPSFPKQFEDHVKSSGCYLVCKTCGTESPPLCFQVSFASPEADLMSKLSPIHKRCYKILKYILVEGTNINRPFKSITLSSYMLKSSLLYHEYEDHCTECVSLVPCILSVIAILRDGFGEGKIRTFFMRHMNVWGRWYKVPTRHDLLPSGVTEKDCGVPEICLVYWFEMWQQILGKVLSILSVINKTKLANEGADPQMDEDFLSSSEIRKHDTRVTEFMSTHFDTFLDRFDEVKETIVTVTSRFTDIGSYTGKIYIKYPSEKVKKLILPKFQEYVSEMERICRRKIDIPTDYKPDLYFEEIISKRKQEIESKQKIGNRECSCCIIV